ncbi:hypothetical protein [Streptacidiphilus sp. EB103A]|uniref:hypothetical protein n=1 Tax=Streptacidiphilus sp. EB103A TaxID=3156275 RepID=UPI003512E04C
MPETIPVRLPAGLVRVVQAGCWFTSVEAITALRAWRDEYPGIVPSSVDEQGAPAGPLARYEELASQVVPTGVVWRAGLKRALVHTGVADRLPASS